MTDIDYADGLERAEMTGANEKYATKRYINVHIAFMIQKS